MNNIEKAIAKQLEGQEMEVTCKKCKKEVVCKIQKDAKAECPECKVIFEIDLSGAVADLKKLGVQ